jgi:hypothetical protein
MQYHKTGTIIAIRVTRISYLWGVLNSATADLTSLMGKYWLTYELKSEYLAKWQTNRKTGHLTTNGVLMSMLCSILGAIIIIAWLRNSDKLRHLNHNREYVFKFCPETLEINTRIFTVILILLRDLRFLQRDVNSSLWALAHNCEKRVLASSCLSVNPSVCMSAWNNSAPTEWIFMKFDIWVFLDTLSRKFNFH